MSRSWTLNPGDTIVRKELHDQFGGRRMGGIGPSSVSPNVFLFSDPKVGERHGYIDGWKDDGCFHYTGEGQVGDQELKQGNAAILHHRSDGRALRLFTGVGGRVRYLGNFEVEPSQPVYTTEAPETGGGPVRAVLVFRLRRIDSSAEPPQGIAPAPFRETVATVPVEESQSERFVVEPDRAPYEAERREAKLVQSFCAFMKAAGHEAKRIRIVPKGEAKPLFCDIYFQSLQLLVEAKGTTERGSVRMALGQLLDYSRFIETKSHAVLLPSCPRPDILALLQSAGVGLYHPDGKGGFQYRAADDPGTAALSA